jgi:hypothetical protein
MNDFVRECEAEWRRLGVPTAAANEMAADLRADLAEAAADGVSAEYVLGNGVFDPRSFAADWATARGLVGSEAPRRRGTRFLMPLGVAAVSVLAIFVGVLLANHPHVSVAAVRVPRAKIPFRPVLPAPVHMVSPGPINQPLGFVLFGVGLAGLAIALVLSRPWQLLRSRRT